MNAKPFARLKRAAVTGAAAVATPLLLAVHSAHAGTPKVDLTNGLQKTSKAAFGESITSKGDLATLVGTYIYALLGLLGVVLVVIIIYAGFLWMTAQGNEEKVKKAKAMITQAVIGTILIFAAYAITNFVVGAVQNAAL